ncbi:MAG: hypothetical protein ACRBB2_00295 [Nitrosopumilus sp.]
MTRRITIMIDDDLDKKIRLLQAKMIQKENKSISYSFVVKSTLEKTTEINHFIIIFAVIQPSPIYLL